MTLVVLAAVAVVVLTAAAVERAPDDPVPPTDRAWLEEHGPLRIGWADLPPLASVGDDGRPEGYGVDIWDIAALSLGIEVEHVVVGPMTDTVDALREGRIDVLGGAGERPDLTDGIHRTEGYAWPPTGVVTRPERLGTLPADLDGVTLTSIPGSPLEAAVPSLYPAAEYVSSATTLGGVLAVEAGEIDAFYGPYALLGALILERDLDLVPVGEPQRSSLPIAGVALDGTEAAEVLDTMRAAIHEETLPLVYVKWTGIDLSNPDDAEPVASWVLPALLGGVLTVAGLVGILLLLRRRVRSTTRDLVLLNEELEARVDQRTAQLTALTARLQRSNKALQRFSTTAAHDLKSPIAAISGIASLLREVPLPDEERQDLLGRIEQGSLRLGRMVDAMLDDASRVRVTSTSVDGDAFAEWVRDVCTPELTVVGGEMSIEVPDGTLDADVEVLRRCTLNLVTNAAKYATHPDGLHVLVQLDRDASAWRLTVADNGPGVPQALWSDVFERGTRFVHDDRGFGLGLASIRDLVRGIGGSIRIGDAALGGAEFVVTLPVVSAEPSDDEASAVETAQ